MNVEVAKRIILILLTTEESEAGKLLGLFASYFPKYRKLVEKTFKAQFGSDLSDYWDFEVDDPVNYMLNAEIKDEVFEILNIDRDSEDWLPKL